MLKSFDSDLQVIIYGCLQEGQNIEKLSFLRNDLRNKPVFKK